MAEIEGGGGGHKKGGKPKGKKLSTRVDFTPMVDLGFLLITFFMLTTSMNKPQTMEINMPIKEENLNEDEKTKIKESQAMTILLTDKDKVVYYFGITDPKLETTNFGKDGIRKILLQKNRELNPVGVDSIPVLKNMLQKKEIDEAAYKKRLSVIKAYKNGLIVVIKADDKSKFKNLVDILDEMLICNIGRYAIVDITPQEVDMLKTVQL
jgi:biopolymer transport protein ExbD